MLTKAGFGRAGKKYFWKVNVIFFDIQKKQGPLAKPLIRRGISDFLMKILETIPEKSQLPVLLPKSAKPELREKRL